MSREAPFDPNASMRDEQVALLQRITRLEEFAHRQRTTNVILTVVISVLLMIDNHSKKIYNDGGLYTAAFAVIVFWFIFLTLSTRGSRRRGQR